METFGFKSKFLRQKTAPFGNEFAGMIRKCFELGIHQTGTKFFTIEGQGFQTIDYFSTTTKPINMYDNINPHRSVFYQESNVG